MRAIVTGRGTSGSWQVRGLQLGKAIGAKVQPNARDFDCDLIIGIKRLDAETLHAIRRSGVPWVWDCVDSYPQPVCSSWTRAQSMAWLKQKVEELKPDGIVWPNKRMQHDAEYEGEQIVLYHHGRPDSKPGIIREHIREVGYEGSERYLGEYSKWLPRECERRGWRFNINPPDLGQMDIVVAFREGQYAGYPQHCYKSNIKLANAQITGRPFVAAPEDGYVETASGAEYFVTGKNAISIAFDSLKSQETRQKVSQKMLAAAPTIDKIAEQYKAWLSKF